VGWDITNLGSYDEDAHVAGVYDTWRVGVVVYPGWFGRQQAEPMDRLYNAGWVALTSDGAAMRRERIEFEDQIFLADPGLHCDGLNVHIEPGVEVTVDGLTWSDIDTYTMTVRIHNTDDVPIEGAIVTVSGVGSEVTNAEGLAVFPGLVPGGYPIPDLTQIIDTTQYYDVDGPYTGTIVDEDILVNIELITA